MKKPLLIGIIIVAVMGTVFYLAYEQGQKRYDHEVIPIEKFLPIPILHEQYSATAVWKDANNIKAQWNPALGPPLKEGDYFICRGKVKGLGKHDFYLLEHGERLYLEKDDLIEPLIHALCALSRGGPEHNHPKTIEESLACLPNDEDTMIGLVTYFNTPDAMRN